METAKIIICDRFNSPSEIEKIYMKIKSFGSAASITENSWVVSSTFPCWEIKDELLELIGNTKSVFVAELDGTYANNNTISNELIIDSILLTQY